MWNVCGNSDVWSAARPLPPEPWNLRPNIVHFHPLRLPSTKYEYDKDYHYDLDDRVDNIWLRANGGGESVLCFGRRFQGSGGSGRGRAPNIRISTQLDRFTILLL